MPVSNNAMNVSETKLDHRVRFPSNELHDFVNAIEWCRILSLIFCLSARGWVAGVDACQVKTVGEIS
jgi:hypothetical protein